MLPKSRKIPLLPIPEKPHKHAEESSENASNELDFIRTKLMYAEKVGYCDTIQCTNIDEVVREAKVHLVHSSSQTEDVNVTSPMMSDKIYAQNFDTAVGNVDRVLFGLFVVLYTVSIAIVVAFLIA
jgi:hypothetical protein